MLERDDLPPRVGAVGVGAQPACGAAGPPATVVSDASVWATCLGRPVLPLVSSQTRPAVASRWRRRRRDVGAVDDGQARRRAASSARSGVTRGRDDDEHLAAVPVAAAHTARAASWLSPTRTAAAAGSVEGSSSAQRAVEASGDDPVGRAGESAGSRRSRGLELLEEVEHVARPSRSGAARARRSSARRRSRPRRAGPARRSPANGSRSPRGSRRRPRASACPGPEGPRPSSSGSRHGSVRSCFRLGLGDGASGSVTTNPPPTAAAPWSPRRPHEEGQMLRPATDADSARRAPLAQPPRGPRRVV